MGLLLALLDLAHYTTNRLYPSQLPVPTVLYIALTCTPLRVPASCRMWNRSSHSRPCGNGFCRGLTNVGPLLTLSLFLCMLIFFGCTTPDIRRRLLNRAGQTGEYKTTAIVLTLVVVAMLAGCLYFLVKARRQNADPSQKNIAPLEEVVVVQDLKRVATPPKGPEV